MRKSIALWKSSEAEKNGVQPTWVRWRIVFLLMAYSFMSWFNRVSVAVADTHLKDEFGLSNTQIGTIGSALLFAYMLCMTPGGWFTDRFGAWLALVMMGFGSALFGALTGLGGYALLGAGIAFTSFLIIRALMGVFTAPIYPASGRMVANWIPFPRRAWANGLVTGAAPLGIASAHVLFGKLIDISDWRTAFITTGVLTALLALVWTRYSTNSPWQHPGTNQAERQLIQGEKELFTQPADVLETRASRIPPPWYTLLRNRSLILLTLSYAAVGYFEYLFFFCTEYYFKGVLHFGVDESRRYAAIASLAMVVTMPLGGWVSDRLVRALGYRLGRAFMPVTGMVASAATLYASTVTQDLFWTVLWFTLSHGAIGATEGACWSTAIELGGRRGGTSGGIFNTGGNAGGIPAPILTPAIGDYFDDWRLGMYLGSLICLTGATLWFWIDPGERVPEDN